MSETETEIRQKKKRKPELPTLDVRGVEEYEQKPSERREESYNSREVRMLIRDKQREVLDEYKARQDFVRAEMEKYRENMATRSITSNQLKMKGDLSNLIKITLADETITAAKGKETHRTHKKVAFIWHHDEETTTEIEIHRGN